MFKKILIANRGKIACRIIKTCSNMGIRTVAIYSEADANSQHVSMADEAVLIGPADPKESYLNIKAIMKAAKDSRSEAIHPGYGFLSENTSLIDASMKQGITFIGPSSKVVRVMGDKIKARLAAQEAGLELVPGTLKPVTRRHGLKLATAIGFPLMVKAIGGGGGIGIIKVTEKDHLKDAITRASNISKGNFASSGVYLEKFIEGASHIEVQIVRDMFGKTLHLFERDCSIQRRNQKIIEESPALKLSKRAKNKIYAAAVRLANSIGYTGVGTVEFLMDDASTIYFLEMNTRLQVEHGITESVTGLDMVALQLKIAAKEPLEISQADIHIKGHSIEARIYPEDPVTLMPKIGVIDQISLPEGEGIRVDSALKTGYEVSSHYDPLLAKIIAWDQNRDDAIRRLCNALEDFQISGVPTNVSLLTSVLKGPSFTSSEYTTELLPRMEAKQTAEDLSGSLLVTAIAGILHSINESGVKQASWANRSWKFKGRTESMSAQCKRLAYR